ncbi:hypothetical protein KAFR_0H03460 [Kazachstania africana CBS 2517]|uniref:PH domain-containing protein n=1 Tax=Kazachstania africana (strain ATCC 22294 / BCRC 22015 / CBS 2517 / CECT 1963 / NBRC 1671 / NRRL Y-8276) TaxID=1071382 RepID=H2AYH9_KAZAF|nr:hypothetical protein KAFR_0H03460 [Kazachstania africana CBS 2517]CCF59756.1 hypothetical protein KAFR_0H03460 [Kazachstania africana CBS 2517]
MTFTDESRGPHLPLGIPDPMSKHNTMSSNVSNMRSQQLANLQQLHSLQQHTRSLTSVDYANQQQAGFSLPQSNPYPQSSDNNTFLSQNNTASGQNVQSNSITTIQNNNNPPINRSNNVSNQQKNSLTSASLKSKNLPRTSFQHQQDPRSPLLILIPTSAQPTDVLAQRFAAWRSVIRSILTYLTETASIQDEIVRQQLRLSHSIQFPFFSVENQPQPSSSEDKMIQKFFLPLGNGSVQDLPTVLSQYHGTLASMASKASKELTNEVIPRLEDLRRDLLVKIKEIKSLQSDFKNSCAKELQQTKNDMKHFIESLKDIKYNNPPKHDPYLLKIVLDKQIKKQLIEENFLHEAFDNLQTSGAELEKVVVMEIQNALTIYARLLGQESQLVFDILISKLDLGFFNKEPNFEWDNFIARDSNFISPNLPMRKMKEIVYKYQYDPLTYEIKSGFLERRSKFLKSYSKGFYVLSPNFLHEFKSADRKKDLIPVMSLSLSECSVAEHSKKGSSDHKFILHAKQNGIIHRGHNWVFKADSYDSMISWYNYLKRFTNFSDLQEKSKYIKEHFDLNNNDRDIDEQDNEEKFPGTPKQDLHQNEEDPTVTLSTPKLDTITNTNTTSSLPDTNNSKIQDTIPNFYIETINPDYKD